MAQEDVFKKLVSHCKEYGFVFPSSDIYNMAYRRFRHKGEDKVTMDFAFFAIAFNIKKMCAKLLKTGKGGTARIICILIRTIMTQYTRNIAAYYQISEKRVA